MSETVNIAAIAEKLSGQLFKVFGWGQIGPTNFNFQEDPSEDKSRRAKYPCDVIFQFEDPFYSHPVFLLTDLKSYAKSSTENSTKLKSALLSLASALRASVKSTEFQKHLPHEGGRISALLFVFNHDGEYDSDFGKLLNTATPSPLDIPTTSSLFVLGPDDIRFLLNVFNDLEKIAGSEKVFEQAFRYYYPNLVGEKPELNEWTNATPEMLLSSYLPIVLEKEIEEDIGEGRTKVSNIKVVHLYYRGNGETQEEFCFIFNYLFRYNLIDDCSLVKIRIPDAHRDYLSSFDKAKKLFCEEFYRQDGAFKKLEAIKVSSIPKATYDFKDNEIGMEKRIDFNNAV